MSAELAAVPDPGKGDRRVPTVEQAKAVGVLVHAYKPTELVLTYGPFDLPAGSVLVMLQVGPRPIKVVITTEGRMDFQ